IAHNGMYTVGNIANVLEQIHEAPADIACLGNDQQRDADAHDEISHADFAVAPQHQCKYQRADFQHQRRRVLKPHTALVGPQPAPRHANFVAQITIEVFALEAEPGEQPDTREIGHGVDYLADRSAARFG